MKLSGYLMMHAARLGKTHHLASLVKELNGTLIVSSQEEQNEVHKKYRIKAIPYNVDARYYAGLPTGIVYVDPSTVGKWVSELERENDQLKFEVERLKEQIGEQNEPGRHPSP